MTDALVGQAKGPDKAAWWGERSQMVMRWLYWHRTAAPQRMAAPGQQPPALVT